MINIGNILKKSLNNAWKYRVLWLFGLLLAITAGARGNNNKAKMPGNGFPANLPENAPEKMHQFAQWFIQNVQPLYTHPAEHIGTIVTIALITLSLILVCCALGALIRYPSETAVIRMVDEYEQSGTKMKFKQGWKLGWNRRAFRIWVIDLILCIPVLVLTVPVGMIGWFVYARFFSGIHAVATFGMVAIISLGAICLLLLIVLVLFIALVRNFIIRAVALDDHGIKTAFNTGWALFKRNLKSAGIMWIVMCGLYIGFGIVYLVAFYLLIPAYLVLLAPAALVAAIPGLIGYGISSLFSSGPMVWVITALSATPFFFTVLFSPIFLVDGWYKVFDSNVWTLTYREIKAKENLAGPVLPDSKAIDQKAS